MQRCIIAQAEDSWKNAPFCIKQEYVFCAKSRDKFFATFFLLWHALWWGRKTRYQFQGN
ncbi:hypothetical protein AOLI_G00033160 [Acnodon oligacanthus]